MSVVTFMSIRT